MKDDCLPVETIVAKEFCGYLEQKWQGCRPLARLFQTDSHREDI